MKRKSYARTPMPTVGRERWFKEHFFDAPSEVIEFLAGDGILLDGQRVADVGCGDGIIDLGLTLRSRLSKLDGFDQVATDVPLLLDVAREHGAFTGDHLPPELTFRTVQGDQIPADDCSYDVVVSWSVFEHAEAPTTLAREIYRILRPGGIAFIQTWPLWASEHGSHLWDWFPNGFAQLTMSADDIEETVRSDPRGDDEWMEYMLDGYASCNGLTIDDLQRALIGGGLFVGKCELLANAFHLDEAVQHYPLSSLGISGVKLLAARR